MSFIPGFSAIGGDRARDPFVAQAYRHCEESSSSAAETILAW
jgi:hypothetical protein